LNGKKIQIEFGKKGQLGLKKPN